MIFLRLNIEKLRKFQYNELKSAINSGSNFDPSPTIKERTIRRWSEVGLLDGLTGLMNENSELAKEIKRVFGQSK